MRTGLLIVDLQAGVSPTPALVERIEREIALHAWVVFTRFTNEQGSLYRTALDWHGDAGALAIQTPGSIVFEKTGYGLTAGHIDVLKTLACEEWHVGGLETDACVLACAFSLWDAGIRPRVRPDLCESPLHAEGVAAAVCQGGAILERT